MIGCTYKDRLWTWDFKTNETLCWTENIVVELKGNAMMVAKRDPDIHRAQIVNYTQT